MPLLRPPPCGLRRLGSQACEPHHRTGLDCAYNYDKLSSCSPSTPTSAAALLARARLRLKSQQHRVLLTLAHPYPSRPASSSFVLRSPHQWSHLAHHRPHASPPSAVTAMATQTQKRSHAGHSHGGHHHHHDNTYLASTNKNDPGVRITRIGLYVNLGMAIVKGVGGAAFHSQALTADAVHALTDLMSDVLTLATISYSIKPATLRFPMGYGKIESLGALAVSGILLAGGLGIGLQAVLALTQQFFPQIFDVLAHVSEHLPFLGHSHSHGHDHGATEVGPHINAAWLALGSIAVKEWLYRATIKVAKEKRSSVLSSNAYHHRVDSLTAFVAFFTIVASNFISAARWLDPVGGLVISGMIVQAGWGNTKSAFLELADVGLDDELRDGAEKAAKDVLQGSLAEVRGVQGIKSGQNLMVEVEVGVPKDWSVSHSNDIEVQIREAIAKNVRGTRRVNVRFTTREPEQEAFIDQFTTKDTDATAEHEHDHDHHDHEHDHNDHSHGLKDKTNGSTSSTSPANGHTSKRK